MSDNLADTHRASSPAARWYPVTVLVTLVLLLSVIPCAILSLAGFDPTNHSSNSTRALYFFDQQKQKIADQIQGHRVVLLGGSGANYSVRAEMLQSQLGVPVINNALQAGLGIDYLLYRARKSLRPGDTAILFFEYAHYFRQEPSWTLADWVFPHDLTYFAAQPLKTQIKLAGQLTPREYGSRVYDAVFGRQISGADILAALNDRGDAINNRREHQNNSNRALLDTFVPMVNMVFQQKSAEPITGFIRWCQKNGITVIAGYPAYMDFPVYHSGVEQTFFQSLGNYYHTLGVPTLGEPADFMFPKSMFFDTHYHLHDEGAAVMTDLVARRLAPLLGVTIKPGSNLPLGHVD